MSENATQDPSIRDLVLEQHRMGLITESSGASLTVHWLNGILHGQPSFGDERRSVARGRLKPSPMINGVWILTGNGGGQDERTGSCQ